MGLLHSFDDKPAIITSNHRNWYYLGKLHRNCGPAIISHHFGSTTAFAWYSHSYLAQNPGRPIAMFKSGGDGVCYMTVGHLGQNVLTRDPKIIDNVREICRRDLGVDLPE